MKRKTATLLITVLTTFLLSTTACSPASEQLELGEWKEQLHDYTNEHNYSYDIDNPFSGSDNSDQESSGESFLDKIKKFASLDINSVVENMEEADVQTTIEENGLIKVKLLEVIDGDTIRVNYNGSNEVYVRFIGVNTPESVNPDPTLNVPEGKEASDYTKKLLSGNEYVWLELDEDQYDDYDRLLAYVRLTSDNSNPDNMVNVILLQNDIAELMTIEPNTKYAGLFTEIAAQ